MKRNILGTAILSMAMIAGTTAEADLVSRTKGQEINSPFMRVYERSLPPIGHVLFCKQFPTECKSSGPKRAQVELNHDRKSDLRTVNALVNRLVRPVSDMELYGRIEHWTYPDGEGDCEDYVLLKQRLLINRGWPASALLITVVRDEKDEGHAVLTVRTSKGDYLLDNKRAEIMTWNESPYTFIKRQSDRDPQVWVSLTLPSAKRAAKQTADTGANQRMHQ